MSIQRLRGTHDIHGKDALGFQRAQTTAREIFGLFGFRELQTPILEEKDLFVRALGTEPDVVQQEMYEFIDRLYHDAGSGTRTHKPCGARF